MKATVKKTSIGLVVVAAMTLSACTTMGADGKQQTNVVNSTGLGAGIGAVVGGLFGGEKGALVGAALGGGVGYLVGTEARKKELESAKVAALEIETTTQGYLKPEVKTQNYQNVSTGEKVEGLKSIDINLPIAQMTNKKTGVLTDKGVEALVKLQAVANKTGTGKMELIVPASLKATTLASLSQAAPDAKIVIGDDDKVKARINPKPVDSASGIKVLV